MSDIFDELEGVIQKHKGAAQSKAEREDLIARLDGIDKRFDTFMESVTESLKGSSGVAPPDPDGANGRPAGGDGDPPAPPVPDPPPPPPELPVERVTKLQVPRIYTGDDEPATVTYTDPDTGEERQRAGRRKGHPAGYDVEAVEVGPPAE